MRRSERRAEVRLHGERVGVLVERPDRSCVFTYTLEWVARPDPQPVSTSLPVRAAPYEARRLHPYFAGLLPEGWNRDAAVRSLGLDPGDEMALLLATGVDCVGAVDVIVIDEADE